MKGQVFFWATGPDAYKDQIPYKHKEDVDDAWEVAKDIFDAGLNVMMYHVPNSDVIILFVDHKRFSQR